MGIYSQRYAQVNDLHAMNCSFVNSLIHSLVCASMSGPILSVGEYKMGQTWCLSPERQTQSQQ